MFSKEDKKIQVFEVLSNQIPDFIKEENPLFLEFLKKYFLSKEIQGGDFDIIRNLLAYKKNEVLFNITKTTNLTSSITYNDRTINVTSTKGWPDEYGLLKIGDEIVTYESKTDTSFLNCKRGFSGVSSLGAYTFNDNLVFEETLAQNHNNQSEVQNLSILFLEKFLSYTKNHFLPGFEDVSFYEGINDSLIASRIKDFYSSKGTKNSFDLLFKILYGTGAEVFLPKDNILKPSSSDYRLVDSIIVEVISGDIESLKGYSIYQDKSEDVESAEGAVYDVNFLKESVYPESKIDATYIQTENLITVTTTDRHSINTGDSLYFSTVTGSAKSRVYLNCQKKDDNTILLISDENITTDGKVEITTIKRESKLFYLLKLSSIDGSFVFNGKTKLLETTPNSTSEITVDSTLGFPKSGSILIGSEVFSYQSKSSNQFLGCSARSNSYEVGTPLTSNRYVYGYENGDVNSKVTMRVVDILSNTISNEDSIINENISLKVKKIGYDNSNSFTESLIYNTQVDLNVDELDYQNNRIYFKSPHRIKKGEKIDIKDRYLRNKFGIRNTKLVSNVEVLNVNNQTPNVLDVSLAGLSESVKSQDIVVSKSLPKGNPTSITFPEIGNELANIQRLFIDSNEKNYYVCASSIPDYIIDLNQNSPLQKRSFELNVNVSINTNNQIVFQSSHGLFSGDKIFFGIRTNITGGSDGSLAYSGSFYVNRITENIIEISLSRSSVDSGDIINLNQILSSLTLSNTTNIEIQLGDFYNVYPKNQKLLKKIKIDKSLGEYYDFDEKPYHAFGILTNGVEIYPPFNDETIYYGGIKSIDVLNGGQDYDLLNPPVGYFDDVDLGSGASVSFALEGTLREILVISTGSNVNDDIKIKILGGNNEDVEVKPILTDDFSSKVFSPAESVNLINDTIAFDTNHTFLNGEAVKYSVIGSENTAIGLADGGNLVSDSIYYVNFVNSKTIRLSNTENDALNNIYINLGTEFGTGDHQIISKNAKKKLTSVDIINPGKFKVKSITLTNPSVYPKTSNYVDPLFGVNLNSNYIFYKNHSFQTGDLVQYIASSAEIGGLISDDYYYIIVIDKNSFRLVESGSDLENLSKVKFNKGEYINLLSITSGSHTFKYPDISITLNNDRSGVSPSIKSVIRGSIENVIVNSEGKKYGSKIINFEKYPSLKNYNGSDASISVITRNGQIEQAYVTNSGTNYYSEPELILNSSTGKYGKLKAVISNGRITDVEIINSGIGYDDNTNVIVRNVGSGAKFRINIQQWRINSVVKNILDSDNEHYLISGNETNSSQVVCSYIPKKLRLKYGDVENRSDSDIAGLTFSHSKILGWAYDGNPIYAQFGYSNPNSTSGGVKRLKSGYLRVPTNTIQNNDNRPGDIVEFPPGFFVNDFYYENAGDLDEYNGRYCITPEYPNGTYAYFSVLDVNGNPGFPYCIYGLKERYDSWNNDFIKSKQTYLENIKSDLVSVTYQNRLFDSESEYSFIDKNIENYSLNVNNVSEAFVDEFSILDSGDDYQIGDKIEVTNKEKFGSNAKGFVSSLKGKTISSIDTTLNSNSEVYFNINPNSVTGILTSPHGLSNRDNVRISISGITTNNFTFLNGTYPINLNAQTTRVIDSIPNTGVTTYIKTTDSIKSLGILPDDVIQIDDEKMKVLSVDEGLNQLKVTRAHDSTSISSHVDSSEISILSSRFEFKTGILTTSFTENYNKIYFEKSQVGIGTTTRTISYVGIKTEVKVDSKKIYIPNHGFETNQKVKYSYGVGYALTVSSNVNLTPTFNLQKDQNIFIVKYDNNFIGLSTTRVSIGDSNPGLYFVNDDTNSYDQSLTYNELPLGEIIEQETIVSLASTHGLSINDIVFLQTNPTFNYDYNLSYDDNLQSLTLEAISINNLGISSANNTVTVTDHGFIDGDQVKYEQLGSATLGADFVDQEIYYVKIFSKNKFAFAKTKSDVENGNILNIGITTSSHQIKRINPQLRVVNGSTVTLGISSIVGSGNPKIEFYEDPELLVKYNTSNFTIDSDQITIDTSNITKQIYFTLTQYGNNIGGVNQNYSSIQVFDSVYDDEYKVTGITSTTKFNIELLDVPEVLSYGSTNSSPKYTTLSKTAYGPIDKVFVSDGGSSFKYPTGNLTIETDNGSSAIIKYNLKKTKTSKNDFTANRTPYDISSDETYRFELDIPSIVSVKSNKKITDIAVVDGGSNYVSPPKVIIEGEEGIIARSELFGKTVGNVSLITKNNGILKETVTVYPKFNTNGIEVINVTKELNNTTLNLFIKEPNNGFQTFPFEVGDEIFVEGIVTTDEDPGSGYNSIDYDLTYFTIIGITTSVGSANVRYSISGIGTNAGTYDSVKSYGRVIKKSDVVKFKAVLENSNYFDGETVTTSSGYSAIVSKNGWNSDNSVLSLINQNGSLNNGDILTGSKSGSKSIVNKIDNYSSELLRQSTLNYFNQIYDYRGKLNEERQVIPDNYYHQTFSYDIKSEVPFDTWKNTVDNLNHISGFEKFGTLIITGITTNVNVKLNDGESSSVVLLEPELGDFYEKKNFDIVNEEISSSGDFYFSKEIIFKNRQITDSIESITNRSILIDDISSQFTGSIDDENGSSIVGVTSFRLTTSETGNISPLFVKSFDSSSSDVVLLDSDKIFIPDHNFSTGEELDYVSTGTKISIASTDRVIGGISTTLLPDVLFVINVDVNNIRLCGLSSDTTSNRYFDLTSLGSGTHTLKSKNQNTRCLITIDGIIQTPLYKTPLEYTLKDPVGIGSTTITLTGVTSITSNSILEIGNELLQVGVVGYGGSDYQLTVDRGFMGTVAAAHTVGIAVSLKKGEYIIKDDVIYFSDAPFSGINTNFDYSVTGIPTSFNRSKFHGRVMQRLNYDNNKIFDDITESFDGSESLFNLTSNNQSTEDIFSNNVGLLTGTDVNSGIILINNVFQEPNVDYQLIQNVGVGASIQFLGSNNENLPSGGQILSYEVNNGAGYQQQTRAFGIVSSFNLIGGSISSVTLTQEGSGYREDMPVTIISNVGSGASVVALVGTGVNAGLITGFRVDDGGSNYSSSNPPEIQIPSPRSYSNLSLTGGSGTGAKVDIVVIGAAGTVFSHELTNIGYGYKEGDVLTVSGIPTSSSAPSYSNFQITVKNTFKDKFSGYTFGELINFDDISDQANDSRVRFSLTRTRGGTKELVSLDIPKGSSFKLQNNLLIFINDILQIPGTSYTFEGGTKVTFTEAPKTGSKISILYYKGSDDDVIETDIRETIKRGDKLTIEKEQNRNISRQLPRSVFDILSSDSVETNIYSNIGLSTDSNLDRDVHWTKQKSDEIIDGEIVYKSRPELSSHILPNVNIIKDIGTTDTEIFVDTIKEFSIDSLSESDNDLICIDSKYINATQAKATLTIGDGYVDAVSLTDGGYGYYESPEVTVFSRVPLEKQIGSVWENYCDEPEPEIVTITGIATISSNTTLLSSAVIVSSGSTLIINDGITYSITGFAVSTTTLYDTAFDSQSNKYYVVGENGLVASSPLDLCSFAIYPFANHTEDPDAVYSIDISNVNSSQSIIVGGQGFVGFATLNDPINISKRAYPVSSGSIESGTFLDPEDKVSIEDQTFNSVKHFETMNGLIAVGSTILTSKNITSGTGNYDIGYDWSMVRIDFGGPIGRTLNDVVYFPKKEYTNKPSSQGYVAVGNGAYIFKSFDGYKWNTQNTTKSFKVRSSSIPTSKNLNSIATDNDSLVAVGDSGTIIRTQTLITGNENWSSVGIAGTTENLTSITYTGQQYVTVSDIGNVYTSIGGTSWVKQTSITSNSLNSVEFAYYSELQQTLISVGVGTIIQSSLESTKAVITSSVTNGIVTSLTIVNPGYGYSESNPPIIQIAPPKAKYELIENVKVEGDFGKIVAISTVVGINTDFAIEFEFEIDPTLNSSLFSNFSLTESGIKTGYYFAVSNSILNDMNGNVSGIDTTLAYSGITSSISINNIYRADQVITSGSGSGIVTVTSNITGIANISQLLNNNVGIETRVDYIANYGWGRFYDFDRPSPKSFEIYDEHDYFSKNPTIQRKINLRENY